MNKFKDKFDGCFFGSIVGDALGMHYEFKHPLLLKIYKILVTLYITYVWN